MKVRTHNFHIEGDIYSKLEGIEPDGFSLAPIYSLRQENVLAVIATKHGGLGVFVVKEQMKEDLHKKMKDNGWKPLAAYLNGEKVEGKWEKACKEAQNALTDWHGDLPIELRRAAYKAREALEKAIYANPS